MYIVKKDSEGVSLVKTRAINYKDLSVLGSDIAGEILNALSKSPRTPSQIAKTIGCHEQTVYYHLRKLVSAGIVKKIDFTQGNDASEHLSLENQRIKKSKVLSSKSKRKPTKGLYALSSPGFSVLFSDFQKEKSDLKLFNHSKFLAPFVVDGKLNAKIIVGSPDPHGPEKARSRDGYYGIDFALFLGTFLNHVPEPYVMLDTEARTEELNTNLILLGGPIVNRISAELNPYLPIHFERKEGWVLSSTISGKNYYDDEIGIIVKAKNVFYPKHSVLLLAGKRFTGTKSAIIAFLKHFSELKKGNIYDRSKLAKVVQGLDLDSDGIIDDVEFLE